MAVGLNKTFLVLSLPIISIVSLYLYCRRQSKPSANSDQLRDDLVKIQPETKRSEDKQSNEYDQSTLVTPTDSTNMQLIANQSTENKMAAEKFTSNKDQRSVKVTRSSSNGTTGDKKDKRSKEATIENVENSLNELSLKVNDNNSNKSNDSSKTLTFAQVLEKKSLAQQQAVNDAQTSTSCSASNLDNNKSNKARESNNDSRKQENKPKSDKVNENGIRNKHSNFNGKLKKNEKSEKTLNNDRPNNAKNNLENVLSNSNESKRSQETSSSNKSIGCASESIVNNHNRVENESKEAGHSDNSWNNKSITKVPTKQPLIDTPPQISSTSSSVCQATSAGDSAELLLNNKSELKRTNDSHPQQSPFSDVYSENSSDSGKGSSENRNETPLNPALIPTPPMQQFTTVEFQFPKDLAKMVIGRLHQNINLIRSQSGADVQVQPSAYHQNFLILSISGRTDQIDRALSQLHQRFPVNKHPYFDLQNQLQYTPIPSPIFPGNFNMTVPMNGICDVILSAMTNAGTLFLIQPTHPLYASFRNMWAELNETYNTFNTPLLQAFQQGIICVAKVQNQWNRAMIFDWIDENNYWIRLVDSGELVQANISSLRQISPNYMSLPFQACECSLNGIQPVDPEAGWSEEANAFVYEFLKGYILKARLIGQTDRGTSLIELFKLNGEKSTMLNSHLVNNGFAKYIQFS